MASTTEDRNKLVTGYPAQPSHVAAGYPQAPPNYSSGIAYPYAAPPPTSYTNHQHHHHHVPPPYRVRGGPSVLCRIIAAILAVFFIIGVIFFIIWLVLKPQLPEFQLDSASLSQLNTSDSELTATWDFTFLIKNPNKKLTIYYDRLVTSVVYGNDHFLSETLLHPFSQPKTNQTTVRARIAVVSKYVGRDIANGISGDRARGSVSFGVRVFALIRFRRGVWRTRWHLLRVYCDGANFGVSLNNGTGTLLNAAKECEVDL